MCFIFIFRIALIPLKRWLETNGNYFGNLFDQRLENTKETASDGGDSVIILLILPQVNSTYF